MPSTFKSIFLILAAISVLYESSARASPQYGSDPTIQQTDTAAVHEDSLVVMVYTTFVVDLKGRVQQAEILQTKCDSCTNEILENCKQEALRVVNDMPRFSPSKGSGNGEPQRYNLPVKFVVAIDLTEKQE